MKIRNGFVSNSSSSSFILVKAGEEIIVEDGYLEDCDSTGELKLKVDDVIQILEKAKVDGVEFVTFEYGGGYTG